MYVWLSAGSRRAATESPNGGRQLAQRPARSQCKYTGALFDESAEAYRIAARHLQTANAKSAGSPDVPTKHECFYK